jgi:hypothetical protein
MQLRNHRLMTYRGCCSWPPVWIPLTGRDANKRETQLGEIGLLKETRYYPTRRGRVFLIIDHEGTEYIGCLMFDDAFFCEKVASRLHAFQGLPIETIGSSEISMPRDFISNGRISL